MSTASRRRRLQALALAGAMAAALAVIALAGPLAPTRVEVAPATVGDLTPTVFGIGTLEARRLHTVGPVRSGRILRLEADHGDSVERGQLLAELDPVDLPERIRAAAAAVAELEHRIEAARARLQAERARLRLARRQAARYEALGRRRQASAEQVQAHETEARAQAAAARAAEAELAALEAARARARAELQALQASREALRLRSPVGGIVVARLAEPGDAVLAGTPVLRIAEPATLWVRARVDQRRARGLRLGLPAEVRFRRDPGRTLVGRVARLELMADPLTEEEWVDVALDPAPRGIPLGSLAEVVIRLPARRGVLWVPTSAVQRHGGRAGVWLVREGRVAFRPLTLGVSTEDGRTEVVAGLRAGDTVVTHAARPLRPGMRVSVGTRP